MTRSQIEKRLDEGGRVPPPPSQRDSPNIGPLSSRRERDTLFGGGGKTPLREGEQL